LSIDISVFGLIYFLLAFYFCSALSKAEGGYLFEHTSQCSALTEHNCMIGNCAFYSEFCLRAMTINSTVLAAFKTMTSLSSFILADMGALLVGLILWKEDFQEPLVPSKSTQHTLSPLENEEYQQDNENEEPQSDSQTYQQ
jgi:hypothetical protein